MLASVNPRIALGPTKGEEVRGEARVPSSQVCRPHFHSPLHPWISDTAKAAAAAAMVPHHGYHSFHAAPLQLAAASAVAVKQHSSSSSNALQGPNGYGQPNKPRTKGRSSAGKVNASCYAARPGEE
ncbi:hypothetical protein MRX96_053014 [Rhipicephalus microplus]